MIREPRDTAKIPFAQTYLESMALHKSKFGANSNRDEITRAHFPETNKDTNLGKI